MLWEYLREEEFPAMIERSHGVCALNIGCVEKHGQHLPVGTDTLHGGKILEMASEREEVCVFPKLYFGDLQGAQSEKTTPDTIHGYGYIALSAELLLQMMREICDEIGRNGFKKILLFSSHGGNNAFLGNFLRAVRAEKKDYDVFLYNVRIVMPKDVLDVIAERGRDYFPALTDEDIKTMEDYVAAGKFDGHGGFGETAMLMSPYPELVRLDRCEVNNGLSRHVTDPISSLGIQWGASWIVDYPDAYSGHAPIGLTKAIADAMFEIHVERVAKVLKTLKDDAVMDPIIAASRKNWEK